MCVSLSLALSTAFCLGFVLHQTVPRVQLQPYADDKVCDLTKKANLVLSLNHHEPEVFVADVSFSIGKNISTSVSFQLMLTKKRLSQGPFSPILTHSFPATCANTCASSSALQSSTPSHILNRHVTSRSISHLLTTAHSWTERWWCITANHRQPYNTINGC